MCCLFIVLSYWFFTCTVTSHVLNVIQIFFFTVTNVTSLLLMTQHLVIWKNFANNWNPSPGMYTNPELKFKLILWNHEIDINKSITRTDHISLLICVLKEVLSSMISCNVNMSGFCICNTCVHDNSSAQARMRQKSRRRCSTDSQENEKATKKIKKVKTYWVCL